MGIRIFAYISLLLASLNFGFSQTENQRKYAIEDYEGIQEFILHSGSTDKLSTHFHSKDTYYDLYLDTPDFLLKKNRLSLRFRKRVAGKKITYGFQLKSEMDSLNSVRMEVEETELDFYKVKMNENWTTLHVMLDSIFFHYEHRADLAQSPYVSKAFDLIDSWISFKAEGAIAPFQKLHFLGFSFTQIQTLSPVACGKTIRMRSHVYSTSVQSDLLGVKKNRVKSNNLPKFFKKHGDHNWLLESSLDQAIFYPLFTSPNSEARIVEYEVENKYYLPEVGVRVLSVYEAALVEKFQAESKLDSKYRQALDLFEEK